MDFVAYTDTKALTKVKVRSTKAAVKGQLTSTRSLHN
jgi:hypothetical protein